MPRPIRTHVLLGLLALAAGLALAGALAACGSSGAKQSEASVERPPLTSAPTASTPTTSTAASTQATATQPTTSATTPPPVTTTSPTTTTRTTTQAPGGAPAGCPSAAGSFIRDVHARGTDCGSARDVADGWFQAVHGGAAPDSQITTAGYSCSGQLSGERASVTCAGAGGTAVTFTASP